MQKAQPRHSQSKLRFRPDIEGLRAVAILLVLGYHAGLTFLPGGFVGVDVFFVISGFLITGVLIRELEGHGTISLPRFYARRAKRLLPAAGLVLVVTGVFTWWAAPAAQLRTIGGDIFASATYVVNWVLAAGSTDPLAEDVGVSPVQHFWMLAVEGQFYILWPLVLLLVGWWVGRRAPGRLRQAMLIAISVVIAASFIWSILLTASNPQVAFFITPTRLWELGIGALVAIGSRWWLRLPAWCALLAGWVGLAAMIASGVVVTAATAWPGWAALLPTLGTAAVIIAGFTAAERGAGKILGSRIAVWTGGLSYSLYLWHWPLLVVAAYKWGPLSTAQGLAIVGASVLPAWLSYRLLENPVRYAPAMERSNRLALSVGANFSLIGVAAGLVLMLAIPATTGGEEPPPEADGSETSAPGPDALDAPETPGTPQPGTVDSLADITWFEPAPQDATKSLPASYADKCQQNQQDSDARTCQWGDPDGEVTVAVVGDSKIVQWQSALAQIAEDHGWNMPGYTKSACTFSAGHQLLDDGTPYTSCAEWNKAVLVELIDTKPDVVLVSNRTTTALADPSDLTSATAEAMTAALADQWQALEDAGILVISILDNPNPGMRVYECVAEHMDDLAACTFDRETGISESAAPVQLAAGQRVDGVQTIDMVDRICPSDECVPVIGNVLIYRQGSHLTDTYVRALTPDLAERLVPAVDRALG